MGSGTANNGFIAPTEGTLRNCTAGDGAEACATVLAAAAGACIATATAATGALGGRSPRAPTAHKTGAPAGGGAGAAGGAKLPLAASIGGLAATKLPAAGGGTKLRTAASTGDRATKLPPGEGVRDWGTKPAGGRATKPMPATAEGAAMSMGAVRGAAEGTEGPSGAKTEDAHCSTAMCPGDMATPPGAVARWGPGPL